MMYRESSNDFEPIPSRQELANRANAQLSTGPATPEGKARSSKNAVKHGLYANKDVLISAEEISAFEGYRESLINAYAPQDAVQMTLVERIASLSWRLRRCSAIEADLIGSCRDPRDVLGYLCPSERLLVLGRYEEKVEKGMYLAIKALKDLQANQS